MQEDVEMDDVDRSSFIMAPPTHQKAPLVTTTLKRSNPVLYFPEVIENRSMPIIGIDVDKWLYTNKITSQEGMKKVTWKQKKFWKVPLTPAMFEKAKEAARSATSHSALAPQWEDAVDDSATPPLDSEKFLEKFFMTGIAPGDSKITNESITLHIQALLEVHNLVYSKDISIGWNKSKTERLAIFSLEQGSLAKVATISASDLFLFGHQVQLHPMSNTFMERRREEDRSTLVTYGIPAGVTGKDLDVIREEFGATFVKIPGFRDSKTGILYRGGEAHFVFKTRKEATSHLGKAYAIDGKVFYLRPLLDDDGRKHKCCYSCGSETHLKPGCPKTKAKELKKHQQVSAFLENKMTVQQSKAFAQRLSTDIALGKSPLPNNLAAYSLAAKKGVLVDPAILKKTSGNQQASYASILSGQTKKAPPAPPKAVTGTTTKAAAAVPPTTEEPTSQVTSSLASEVDARFAELELRFNNTVEELKKENQQLEEMLKSHMNEIADKITTILTDKFTKMMSIQIEAFDQLKVLVNNHHQAANQRLDNLEIIAAFIETPELDPSSPNPNKRKMTSTPLGPNIEQGSSKGGSQ